MAEKRIEILAQRTIKKFTRQSCTYFKYLDRLSEGDTVKITDKEGKVHLYEVISWEVVGPYDNSVKAQGEGTELTLLTCENSGTMRLIYHCIYMEAD